MNMNGICCDVNSRLRKNKVKKSMPNKKKDELDLNFV